MCDILTALTIWSITMKQKDSAINSSTDFNKSLMQILSSLLEDKMTGFLEFCITTNNAKPIEMIISILSTNQFKQ